MLRMKSTSSPLLYTSLGCLIRIHEIRDVHKVVDAFLDSDEDTEVRDVPNCTVDDGADGVFLFDDVPGVGLKLPHTQVDALVLDVDAEDLVDETSISTSFEGCLTRLFQVISEMWTRSSMPSRAR